MNKVNVSVIVPVYNVYDYLDICLKSLVNQKFDNYEVIVVNDGSPDNSEEIMQKYAKKYPSKIRCFTKKNGGVSSARNYGLKKARGEYVVFIDSDDYVTNNYLKVLYDKITKTDSDIIICNIYKTYTDRKEEMIGLNKVTNDNLKNALLSMPACWNKMYKKSLFIDNNIYFSEIACGEDLATISRLIVCCKKIDYVDKVLYYYVQRDNSIMNSKQYNIKHLDIFKALEIVKDYFTNNGYYDLYKEEIEYMYIVNLLHDFTLRVYKYKEGYNDIRQAINIIKSNYKKWYKNKYFKNTSLKYKIVCYLIYLGRINILRLILK